ncbi:MAG: SRPBCC domain-containing protein [Calditrichaeota bacterium]|nr:MAG: SRPBCC domain-containing protein [Calditrichota bacterium]
MKNRTMNTRKHIHEESFPTSPERLFSLLHTPSAIRGWWGASRVIVLPETGGIWAATWGDQEDDPEYITSAKIREFQPPQRLVLCDYQYYTKSGPLPFEMDFVTEFLVTPHDDGASLKVIQDGFPAGSEADEFYAACVKGWKDTFAGIHRFLETAGEEN